MFPWSTSSRSQTGKARQLILSDITKEVSFQTPRERRKWLPLLPPPPVCKGPSPCLQVPPLVPRQTLCTVRLVVPREDAAFTSSSANPIMSYPRITVLAPTSPSLRLRGPSFRCSHSCFSDHFVHARSSGVSEIDPNLLFKSVTHTLISFVCMWGGVSIWGWRLQDNLWCHFLGNVHLFVETGSHGSRTLLAG